MSNNPLLYNAVVAAGADLLYQAGKGSGGTTSATYTTLRTRILAVAVQVDTAIAAIPGGAQPGHVAAMSSIARMVLNDPANHIVASTWLDEIATVIATHYALAIADLENAPYPVQGGLTFWPADTASDILTPTQTHTTYAAVNSNPDTITDSGAAFLTDGFRAGMIVTTSGFSAGGDNGVFPLTAAVAGTLTLPTGSALTAESAGASVTINATRTVLGRAPASGSELDMTLAAVLADGDVPLGAFLTTSGTPTGALAVPVGRWEFHFWAWVSSIATAAGATTIKWRVSKVTSAGVETTLFTTAPTTITTTTEPTAQEVVQAYSLAAPVVLGATDRIQVTPIVNAATSTARTIHLLYQGTTRGAYVVTPF
jgi:hypothetical protein